MVPEGSLKKLEPMVASSTARTEFLQMSHFNKLAKTREVLSAQNRACIFYTVPIGYSLFCCPPALILNHFSVQVDIIICICLDLK